MRQPKFRGFSLETKQWHYGHGWFEIDYTDEYLREKGIEPQALLYTGSYPVECEMKSMGEYTGLKDYAGKEIYEGDIVEEVVSNNPRIFEVKWDDYGMFLFVPRSLNDSTNAIDYYELQDEVGEIIVIGNIYEHPHLLQEGASG